MAASLVSGRFEQVSAHRVQTVVVTEVHVETLQQGEAMARSVRHRRCDCPIERDHRIAGQLLEQVVQRQDLGPIGVVVSTGLIVHGRDCRLDLVLAHLSLAEGAGDQGDPLGDQLAIPTRARSGALSTWRTSIGWRIGIPFGPGAADA